jgi:hypothetical protein
MYSSNCPQCMRQISPGDDFHKDHMGTLFHLPIHGLVELVQLRTIKHYAENAPGTGHQYFKSLISHLK